jgi:hypothetical protein
MEIKLREIDRSSWGKCCELKVEANQNFVASNSYSLAQAAYEPDTYLIQKNGRIVYDEVMMEIQL